MLVTRTFTNAELRERLEEFAQRHFAPGDLSVDAGLIAEVARRLPLAPETDVGLPPLPEGTHAMDFSGYALVYTGTELQDFARDAAAGVRQAMIDWAAGRWHAEVANRPLANVHRRPLDDAWRQVLTHLGVDHRVRLGPTHDELAAAAKT